MRVIARRTLKRFLEKMRRHKDYAALEAALNSWYDEAQKAEWRNSSQVKAHFGNASIVSADRVVFNIKGNSYRLIVSVNYIRGLVFIKWIGTHKEYDTIDARTIQYEVEAD